MTQFPFLLFYCASCFVFPVKMNLKGNCIFCLCRKFAMRNTSLNFKGNYIFALSSITNLCVFEKNLSHCVSVFVGVCVCSDVC